MERVLLMIGAGLTVAMLIFAAVGPPGGSGIGGLPQQAPADPWFQDKVVHNPKTVLVEFGATWCGPCKALAPTLDRLEQSHSANLDVVQIDVDEHPALAAHYSISSIPAMLVFKNGQLVDSMRGSPPPDEAFDVLSRWIQPRL